MRSSAESKDPDYLVNVAKAVEAIMQRSWTISPQIAVFAHDAATERSGGLEKTKHLVRS
jgi:hypothetical protein